MLDLNQVCAALERINWDFPNSGTNAHGVHALHAFPGNSIPQIPAALIQILSQPGNCVLDPFGGSGTTAIEALRLGRDVICSDILSPSVLAIRGKIAAFMLPNPSSAAFEILSELTWDHECETDEVGKNGEGANEELSKWYHPRTLRQLRYIWSVIEKVPPQLKPVLDLIFSDVLFACASTLRSKTASGLVRRHHWGWIADNVQPQNPEENNAIENFRRRLVQVSNLIYELPRSDAAPTILRQDARALALRNESVDLVVTSPPYVGVIDYARANRLAYLWRNWNLDEERKEETGARYKRGRKSLKESYLDEMRICWKEVARVLKPGGFCAVVIGESRAFPGTVEPTLADMSCLLSPAWGVKERRPSRRRVSDRSASDAVEYLMVWRKE